MKIERGAVVLVALESTRGHEQQGVRPCVVVSDPEVGAERRFPLVCVVPITGTAGTGALYPALRAGGGLRKPSWAMIDQLRTIDKRRVRRVLGAVAGDELGRSTRGSGCS